MPNTGLIHTMNDGQLEPLVTFALGVAAGVLAGLIPQLLMLRLQRASQARYEVWMRVLNSYQDLQSMLRQLAAFERTSDPDLRARVLVSASKTLSDAQHFDVHDPKRPKRMRAIIQRVATEELSRKEWDAVLDESADVLREFLDATEAARWPWRKSKVL